MFGPADDAIVGYCVFVAEKFDARGKNGAISDAFEFFFWLDTKGQAGHWQEQVAKSKFDPWSVEKNNFVVWVFDFMDVNE